jgi:hypothetical protein
VINGRLSEWSVVCCVFPLPPRCPATGPAPGGQGWGIEMGPSCLTLPAPAKGLWVLYPFSVHICLGPCTGASGPQGVWEHREQRGHLGPGDMGQ